MSVQSIRAEIESHIANNFAMCPVVFENTPSVSGITGEPLEDQDGPWVRCYINFDAAPVIDVPGQRVRQFGSVDLSVRVREETGNKEAGQIIEELDRILLYKQIGSIWMQRRAGGGGSSLGNGWQAYPVSFGFYSTCVIPT